ncbi:MAG TPA: hypothetical protein PLO93_03210 [Candidatus Omnitrophota bacterium]|nr:hypothetical protein [Candidatus Omnitrophota bacterium]HQL41284.1 hypothetical protein [Candidatus Omnitrophota bacterium]
MRKISVVILLLLFVLCPNAFAHPPQDIILAYDPSSRTLAIEVLHSSYDPNRHHINRLEVSINGNVILEKTPNRQNNTKLEVNILIPHVDAGATLEVKAFCSRGGTLTKSIIVP